MRAPGLGSRAGYAGASRELLLLLNNVILVVALAVVMIGTLYPLAYEAATGGEKISIGPPYFNRVFVPLMFVLAAALAVAPVSRWRRTPARLFRGVALMLGAAAVLGVALPLAFAGTFEPGAALAVALAVWIAGVHASDAWRRRSAWTRGYAGMVVAHLGFAVSLAGVAVTSTFSHAVDARMAIGDTVVLNDVAYRFADLRRVEGPNYVADRGEFVTDGGVLLYPEKRLYEARAQVMTEAGIAAGFTRDLYVTLGEKLPDGSWAVRINDKPLVRWVWLGALLIALGGTLSITDARYRRLARRDAAAGRHGGGRRTGVTRMHRLLPLTAFAVLAGILYLGFTLRDPDAPAIGARRTAVSRVRPADARRPAGTRDAGRCRRRRAARQRLGHLVPDLPRGAWGTHAHPAGDGSVDRRRELQGRHRPRRGHGSRGTAIPTTSTWSTPCR